MSTENAKGFLNKVAEDKALKERLAGKEPEEILSAAKELGLECTREELEEAVESKELSPDEMADASGGDAMDVLVNQTLRLDNKTPPCTNPAGHHWVYIHHKEEENTILGFIRCGTLGYDYYRCSYCNVEKRIHVRKR